MPRRTAYMLLRSLTSLPSLHSYLDFPQMFNTSSALFSFSLLRQLHSEICLNLPRTLGRIYWKVVQLNLCIDPSWGWSRLFGQESIDDLNYQTTHSWFMSPRDWPSDLYPGCYLILWVMSYRDRAKIFTSKDNCEAIITRATVLKLQFTWKQHALFEPYCF